MHTDGTDGLQKPAWAAGLLRQLGQAGPLTAAELTERLQAHHPGLTAEQVERELRARGDAHETAGGWVSLLALADGAVLSHLLGAEERKAGVLAADGDLDLWARLADEGLPLAGGGMVRTRWAFGAQELPGDASAALAGPDGWLEAFEDDTILTLRLRGGALEVGSLTEQQAVEDAAERVERVVEACALAAMDALIAFAEAVRVDYPDDDGQGDGPDEPSDPGAPIDDVLVELLLARPGMLDDPMPPLSLLLTAAGLEVVYGAVLLGRGAAGPQRGRGPDGCGDPRVHAGPRLPVETRGRPRLRRGLGRFLSVLTLSPLVLERVADEVERNPADAALLEAARKAAATPYSGLRPRCWPRGPPRAMDARSRRRSWSWRHAATTPTWRRRFGTRPTTRPHGATPPAPTRTCAGQVPRRRTGCVGRCGRCWSRRRAPLRATARARAGRDASTSSAACAPPPIPCPRGPRRAMPASRPTRRAPSASRWPRSWPRWPSRKRPCSRSTWRSSRAASSTTTWTSAGTCCQRRAGHGGAVALGAAGPL